MKLETKWEAKWEAKQDVKLRNDELQTQLGKAITEARVWLQKQYRLLFYILTAG